MTFPTDRKRGPLNEHQVAVLDYVRAHPGCQTSDVAHSFNRYLGNALQTLESLQARGLLGRQKSTLYGYYESQWFPEKVADA